MTTTIRDVAAWAGLSVMTVSRVLNGERHVSAEARDRVQAAVSALGYRRNVFARGLPGSRSFLICLLIPEIIPAYVAEFQQGAIQYCRAEGYHVVAQPYDSRTDVMAGAVVSAIAALRPDGFLLLPPMTDDLPVLEALDRARTPYVRMAPSLEPERASSISIDDVQAAREMTEALLDLGHEKIGFILGPGDHAASAWRFEGYRLALEGRGRAIEPRLVQQGDFMFDGGETSAMSLLTAPDRPTAIFGSNDETAIGVMAAAHRLGLSVPGDLSVAGFDDSEIARLAWPQLTTVRQPIQAMAAAAAELVIGQADAEERKVEHRRLDFSLVFRGTTAAPPSV
ncbi:MAG: LacI family DNA-binding transcriptional regulator [Pseudomonadota bacterium]|uniref:LacI family DNA-binding transcriptional regulator n=1 Tax=unclassified Phenylobacterium TaxID=2640670 RepID=UPI000AACA7C5|nr:MULTISPECIES: LacI family DNA-binding transcriptional regulator [unclassified Phenylobacterium]